MIFDIKSRLYAGFVTAIILVLLLGIISYATFQREYRQAGLVKHSYQVINQLQSLEKQMVDMVAGRRAFRTSNDKRFLERYYSHLEKIDHTINNLEHLIQEDPEQVQRAELLDKEIFKLINYWKILGDDASGYSRDYIIGVLNSEKEKMDGIRSVIEQMMARERLLLSAREKDNLVAISTAKSELVAGILFILIIVILLISQILKEFQKRQKAEFDLKKNFDELTKLNEENQERNWLLTGLAKINDALQTHDLHPDALCGGILDSVVECLKFNAGAFYTYNEDEKKLFLTASYALPNDVKKEYQIHEGFVGQAALREEPLVITDLPAKYASVQTATVCVDPGYAVYASLHHNKQLKGIIEVFSFKQPGERPLRLLKAVRNNIAVALHSAQSREKVLQLLEQVQQQKKTLENQQEELTLTNEELTTQAEVLQASEEELRVQEEELRQINAELKEKNEAIEATQKALTLKAKELELASRYKSEFLANMSHELRTPLNSVLILAKLLADNKDNNLTEKQITHAKIIYRSGSDLLELINDILDLSKIEAGKAKLHIETVSLKSIASDIEQLFAAEAEEKSIEYSVTLAPNIPDTITTDKQKVEQVLKNLLSNAFKFTAKKGKVQLEFKPATENGAEYIAISVKDTGIGIPKEKQEVIFQAFQQADGATNRKYGGTGLGLSITKELMALLKGTIRLESEVNKGSAFTILIPEVAVFDDNNIEEEKEDERDITLPEKVTEQSQIADDRKMLSDEDKSVLIIEDDENFASVVKEFAVSKGYKTIVALSGDEGLYCARTYKPSAIILDVQLPGIHGWTLLKMFKKEENLKNIPVHVISAYSDKSSASSGAIAFMEKPLAKEDFEEAFRLIGKNLKCPVKRVMIFSKKSLKAEFIGELAKEKNSKIIFDEAESIDEVLEKLRTVKYDCIIADVEDNIHDGILALTSLNAELGLDRVPVITYLSRDITQAEELKLRKVSNVIVRESAGSNTRLMDEIELFLYKVDQSSIKRNPLVTDPGTGDNTLKNKKVLIVDDDMRNVFAISTALEQEEMQVLTAHDGEEAIEILKNNNVDIVLLDIMMPHMSGYDALNHIRNTMHLKKLPVLAITAKAMVGDKEKCLEAGASDYVSKPVDSSKLISLMKVWLS